MRVPERAVSSLHEPVAQPVEHVTFNHGVVGSSPHRAHQLNQYVRGYFKTKKRCDFTSGRHGDGNSRVDEAETPESAMGHVQWVRSRDSACMTC